MNSNDSEDFNFTISNHFSTFFDNINHKNFKSSFKKEKEEKKSEKEITSNDIPEMNDTNEEMNNIKKKLLEFNNLFIEQQRELNTVIKSLLEPKIQKRKSSSSRKNCGSISSKNLYNETDAGFIKRLTRKFSSSSKSSSEDEYDAKSFEVQNDHLFSRLNDSNSNINNSIVSHSQTNVIPSFPFIQNF